MSTWVRRLLLLGFRMWTPLPFVAVFTIQKIKEYIRVKSNGSTYCLCWVSFWRLWLFPDQAQWSSRSWSRFCYYDLWLPTRPISGNHLRWVCRSHWWSTVVEAFYGHVDPAYGDTLAREWVPSIGCSQLRVPHTKEHEDALFCRC